MFVLNLDFTWTVPQFRKLACDFLRFNHNVLGTGLSTFLPFSPIKSQTHLFSRIPTPDSTNEKSQGKQKHKSISLAERSKKSK